MNPPMPSTPVPLASSSDAALEPLIVAADHFVGADFNGHLEQFETGLTTVKKIVVIGEHERHESYEEWVSRRDAVDRGTRPQPADRAQPRRHRLTQE